MKRSGLLASAFVVSVLHSGTLFAQSPSQVTDRRLTEGIGIKAGDLELHPSIAAEAGYDTNYFLRSGRAGNIGGRVFSDEYPTIKAYRLRITPAFSFQTAGRRRDIQDSKPRDLEASGRLAASYNALFATESSLSEAVTRQNHIAGVADVGLNIGPAQQFGADLNAGVSRLVEPSNNEEYFAAFRRDVIRGGIGLNIRPGGGTLTWRFGYSLLVNIFEEARFGGYNNLQHRFEVGGTWKFLPRTALLYRGDVTVVNFANNPQTLTNGQIGRSTLGINGLITNYFGFLAAAGWGGSFFQSGAVPAENFDSFIGQLELTWYPEPQKFLPAGTQAVGLSSGSIGYTRNFIASYLGNYYQRDRGYIDVVYLFGQKFAVGATAGFSRITRPPAYFQDGSLRDGSAGGDNRVDLLAFFEFRVLPTLGINLTGRYDAAVSPKQIALIQGPPVVYDDLRFTRFQAFLGVRWFY